MTLKAVASEVGDTGTVTSVSVVTANGVSGSVANPTLTPAITLTLSAITPSSVAIGAGAAITSSGAGGALGSNAFTSTAYAPVASPTFTGTQTLTTALSTTLAIGGATIGANAFAVTGAASVGGKLTIVSGNAFQIGNAATTGLVAGTLAALTNATIVITDSTGQAYRIPCII